MRSNVSGHVLIQKVTPSIGLLIELEFVARGNAIDQSVKGRSKESRREMIAVD
jgi:hypothetical protein